jgi:hypothetical protein
MLDPALGQALADIGGFALFLLTVVTAGIGLFRRWWVPGWVLDREVEARKIAETQALRNAESLERLARASTGERDERPRR